MPPPAWWMASPPIPRWPPRPGRDYVELLKEICAIVPGSVSAEVLATDYRRHDEGRQGGFAKIAKNITIKVPLTWDGLKACRALSDDGLMVNVTLCFSPVQAMMAAKAGATFISPFIGRVDDVGEDGMGLIRDIRAIYDNYGFKTEILAASIRSVSHVREAALAGADVGDHADRDFQEAAQPSLDRQGPGRLHRRRQEGECDDQDADEAWGVRRTNCRKHWLASLAHERRASPNTLRAYGDDVARFHRLSARPSGRRGEREGAGQTEARRYPRLHRRRRRSEGLGAGGVQRALAAVRSFYKFLAREGILENAAPRAIRTPRLKRRLAAAA